jgi:hypothetical protein
VIITSEVDVKSGVEFAVYQCKGHCKRRLACRYNKQWTSNHYNVKLHQQPPKVPDIPLLSQLEIKDGVQIWQDSTSRKKKWYSCVDMLCTDKCPFHIPHSKIQFNNVRAHITSIHRDRDHQQGHHEVVATVPRESKKRCRDRSLSRADHRHEKQLLTRAHSLGFTTITDPQWLILLKLKEAEPEDVLTIKLTHIYDVLRA